jgi:hypothetical protein
MLSSRNSVRPVSITVAFILATANAVGGTTTPDATANADAAPNPDATANADAAPDPDATANADAAANDDAGTQSTSEVVVSARIRWRRSRMFRSRFPR